MKEQKFIIAEIKKHLAESAKKNKHYVIDAVQNMPTFEGFILPYYVSTLDGAKYPVDVENLYIYCEEWEEFYNEQVVAVAQSILEGKKFTEA